MSIEDPADLDQQLQPASPGALLCAARQSAGLSQKQVADQLHITVHYVRSIEQDAYEKLPGTIFAKGYIKRYAEILGMNADELVVCFESYQQEQQDQQNEVTRIHARKHRARNRNIAIASVVIFAGLFAGLWAWNVLMIEEPQVENQGNAAVVTEVPAERTVAAPAANPAVRSNVATPGSSIQQTPLQNEPTPRNDAVEAANPVDVEAIAPDNYDLSRQGDETPLKIISIANEGNDVLRVSFDDESFIQVSDEESNRIYRGTLGKGEVLEITDDAPFNVLLGDAPFAHLTFNGAEIDVSDSIRIDNSARLTVGL